jgi:hypothetical protein
LTRAAQTGLDERERRDDNGLGDVLLWAAVQGPRRGQQSPLSGRGAEALRGVRDRRERRMPDPQGAGELLRLGSSVGGETDRAELSMRPAQFVSGPRLELRAARCLDSTSRRLGETHFQLRIVAPVPNARGRRVGREPALAATMGSRRRTHATARSLPGDRVHAAPSSGREFEDIPVPTDRALIEDLIEASTILAAKSSRTPTITGAPWIAGIAPNSSA